MTDTQMPLVAPVILPEMYKIFSMAEVLLYLLMCSLSLSVLWMQAPILQLSVWTVLFSVTAINDCTLHLCDTPAWIASLNCFHCCRFTVFVLAPEQWRYSPPVPTWSVLLKSLKRWGGVSKRFSFKLMAFQKGFYSCITFISAFKWKV